MALACTVLAGCSALRFGYNQAPELAYWWLDGYADFDESQSRQVRDELGRWFAWHRRTQLPEYARMLARAQVDALADTSPERACTWWRELRERGETALAEALPPAAELVAGLSAAQIAHVERRQAKSNEEFRSEYLSAEPAQRLKESATRAIERAEFFYGRLDEAQRERVARLVAASPFDAERWFAERQQRQRDAIGLLRRATTEKPGRDATLAMLRAYAHGLFDSPREDYRRYVEKLESFNCSFAASLHNSTTPTQRQALAARLKGWEADFRALSADAK